MVLHRIVAEKAPGECKEFTESNGIMDSVTLKVQEPVVFEPPTSDGNGSWNVDKPFDKNTCKHFVHDFFGSLAGCPSAK